MPDVDDQPVAADQRPGPMAGVTVVEVAAWVSAPSSCGILADWGAEVIKIEPFNADPFRGIVSLGPNGINPPFEMDNRGKRDIGVDITHPTGLRLLHELLERADVFVTNLRPSTLEQIGIDPDTLMSRFPRLIYANVTGYGHFSEHRDRPSYDIGGFWARSGGGGGHTTDGSVPPSLRGGYGDHVTGMTLAGGISAALFERERTGRGRHVTTSLLRAGIYAIGQDITVRKRAGIVFSEGVPRTATSNPMLNSYQAGDGRWFFLLGLQPDRHFPIVINAIGRADLADDERFVTLESRRLNSAALVAELDAVFATKDRDAWEQIFAEHEVWYEPVLSIGEVAEDEIAVAAGAYIDVPSSTGDIPGVNQPLDFAGTTIRPKRPVPGHGEHTDEVLAALGYDTDAIIAMKIEGAVL